VELEGDAERGKQVFATACIACHVAEGAGNPVGPDLAAITDRSREALLIEVELRASRCRIDGEKIAYMPDFDALGWWTSENDHAEWTVILDRPGTYRVEWEYSVSPEAAGNAWQLQINGKKALGGTVESTGSWETFRTQSLGKISLPAADNAFVIRSEGPVERALLDLRRMRLIPVEK